MLVNCNNGKKDSLHFEGQRNGLGQDIGFMRSIENVHSLTKHWMQTGSCAIVCLKVYNDMIQHGFKHVQVQAWLSCEILLYILLAIKSRVFKTKNNGHQNFTLSLGIPDPPFFLGNIPKNYQFFQCFPQHYLSLVAILSRPESTDWILEQYRNSFFQRYSQ